MASWMVHLRIADKLLDKIPGLSPTEFIVGNIAPDSGVPNEDWSAFSPDKKVSHFKGAGNMAIPESYAEKYFTLDQRSGYNEQQFSFYLGYLTHLITDVLWVRDVYAPSKDKFPELWASEGKNSIWKLKADWYDLDFKYLRDHPGFRAFRLYLGAAGFVNDFMDEFSTDAFDNRRQYITGWYLEGRENLDRKYPFLTEQEMTVFVNCASDEILDILHTKYGLKL